SLGVKVLPSQWNERQRAVRKAHPYADLINELIRRRVQAAEEEILKAKLEDGYATAAQIQAALSPSDSACFLAYAERYIESFNERGNARRYRRLKSTLGKLEAFAGRPLRFERFDVKLVRDFETHLLQKDNKQSTISANLRDLRSIVNRAIDERLIGEMDSP